MNWFRKKKWMIGCIAMAIVLLILVVNSIALYKQIDELKKESVGNLNAEWYQLLVNQTAHHFTGRPDDLSVNMRNLLVLAYDPLFTDLSLEEGPLNKEEASKLLTDMNDDIMLIRQKHN